jgi:hypothetical protein
MLFVPETIANCIDNFVRGIDLALQGVIRLCFSPFRDRLAIGSRRSSHPAISPEGCAISQLGRSTDFIGAVRFRLLTLRLSPFPESLEASTALLPFRTVPALRLTPLNVCATPDSSVPAAVAWQDSLSRTDWP